MLPSRFMPGQPSAMRKSKIDNRPSLLPKPRRPGSTDRLSTEARRPSTTGHRSSSAEPRSTFGGARLSREASATKLAINGRSRSQTADRYGQTSMTPLRSNQYSRPTTTPVRTPSEDRSNRSWQTSLDRALAFVTIKDQRAISSAAWQRAELARVQEALAARGGGALALLRPLTIARFVHVTGALLSAITQDPKLNNDNYVAKLPHLSKRLLYPGTVSKSWLKTVNTLHAFPQALALIAYLLDLVNHIEMPIQDEDLYVDKGELARLRREYLYKCWIRFQDPGHKFEDLNEEYLLKLEHSLGNNEEKIKELHLIINKHISCLEDEAEAASRAEESRLSERHGTLGGALRAVRATRRHAGAEAEETKGKIRELALAVKATDADMERLHAENEQLKQEIETQPMSVEERTKLRDEIDYANRVHDSKKALALRISKMVMSKEGEVSLWQQKTLDSCLQYQQGLIHLGTTHPSLDNLAIDEKELMAPACNSAVSEAVERLRACSQQLAEQRAEHARQKTATSRKITNLLEETRAKIDELKTTLESEQESLEAETQRFNSETAEWNKSVRSAREALAALAEKQDLYREGNMELSYWEQQDKKWRAKLSSLQDYVKSQKDEANRLLENGRLKRSQLVLDSIRSWNEKLA